MTLRTEASLCPYDPAGIAPLTLAVEWEPDDREPEKVVLTDATVWGLYQLGVRHLIGVLAGLCAGSVSSPSGSLVDLGYFEWGDEADDNDPSADEVVTVALISAGVVEALRATVAAAEESGSL